MVRPVERCRGERGRDVKKTEREKVREGGGIGDDGWDKVAGG